MIESPPANYLDKLPAWTELSARQLAAEDNIELTAPHLEILLVARQFYADFGFSPSMRPLIRYIADHLNLGKARSIYLMQLFPPSPAKVVARLAGLPKPKNCL
ncbi:TusE/DsrC/DsvC family sulfur relay protein [Porticoccus sp.]